ncbi:hypothetical protein ASPZODRAFT_146276 [Penicilliopsis zonata CBS 506.65]|uniref:DUF7924 domain-containing protein n=1 Tax=Penicilliopsis zonata CBS 506.65 TaxID=1073090 RepID=A0A1L9S7X9_9EURO|nr:hypothetical protein ASPZODRAFT_146276 [Penicilliopsis zonata CBS 506.65]OJJ43255.1 hypothetical protein ASPZODRAFT_146276 [Penicilliopsis zonata CBS 506.65]
MSSSPETPFSKMDSLFPRKRRRPSFELLFKDNKEMDPMEVRIYMTCGDRQQVIDGAEDDQLIEAPSSQSMPGDGGIYKEPEPVDSLSARHTITPNSPKYVPALVNRRIYPVTTLPPRNWVELESSLKEDQPAAEPQEESVLILEETAKRVTSVGLVSHLMLPMIINLKAILYQENVRMAIQAVWKTDISFVTTGLPTFDIADPSPTLTVGYNLKHVKLPSKVMDILGSSVRPVACDNSLIVPCFTLEVDEVPEVAERKNLLNAAIMLRALRCLRTYAGISETTVRQTFDWQATVLTATLSRNMLGLHCHYTTTNTVGAVEYHAKTVKKWPVQATTAREGIKYVRNAVSWAMRHNWQWIPKDLES